MSYQFSDHINSQEHDEFVKNHPLCNLLQSSAWGSVKQNWKHEIVGVYEDGKLVASSLVLIKPLPLHFTMLYVPRGPILDFHNKELVAFYFKSIRKWAKKYHCLFIKFDPGIHVRDFTLDKKDTPYVKETEEYLETLKKCGAVHQGFTLNIIDTIQPRFHMGVPKCDDLEAYIPRATVRSKNVAIRKHVKVEEVGKAGLEEFAKVMHMTEVRKDIHLRGYEYFKHLLEVYPDNSYLFLAKVNPQDRKNELEALIEKDRLSLENPELSRKQKKLHEQNLKQEQDELNSMQDVLAKYDGETVIAGGLMIGFGPVMEMLYAGMNEDFRTFRPQYLTYYTQFEFAFEHGYDYVTMGGVEGSLEDGLSMYKSAYNPVVNEFIGEFDLPVNGILYRLSEWAYKLRKHYFHMKKK